VPLEFGTDGIRGVANQELTPELVLSLGRAAARVLGHERWLIGRDTRRSGPMLGAALAAGLSSEGADVIDLGVLPTPAVAHLSERRDLPAAVISASHNAFADNGIKLFAAGGRKLSDQLENRLEAELAALMAPAGSASATPGLDTPDRGAGTSADQQPAPSRRPVGRGVGVIGADPGAEEAYAAHLMSALDGRRLGGLHVVLDCANGAASVLAPRLFSALGAQVDLLHGTPDGVNINHRAGSTYPAALQEKVVSNGAHAGLAFDGDADRVLAVDHTGALVDGDHILAVCALDLHGRGLLTADTVVVTVMTNLGFRLAMAEKAITVIETQVGDRYVLEALEAGGLNLGGEQSGHIIFRDVATTGDGILTGLRLLDVVVREQRSLHDLAAAAMTGLPQVLTNVRVADREGLAGAESVWAEVAAVEAALGKRGRVLLRPSGTEPLVRVMAEAPTSAEAHEVVDRLCRALEAALGKP
jgi:phosphoglucosamine mutase